MSNPPSLHLHCTHSVLDGVPSPKDFFVKAESIDIPAIAFTDHGSIGSWVEATLESKSYKVKPILGLEGYVVSSVNRMNELRSSTKEEDREKLKEYKSSYHAVFLVKNEQGYKNLIKINNLAWTDGFYYKPRTDYETIFKYKDGLVCSSACQSGIISKLILNGRHKRAKKVAKRFKEEFGEDFYLELQLLDMDVQDELNSHLIKLGKSLDISFLLTNDVHYVNKGDHEVQMVLMEVATKGGFSYKSTENYLKTLEDLERIRDERGSIPKKIFYSAIDNCFKVADLCNYTVPTGNLYFPKYDHKMHFFYKKFPIKNKTEFFKKMVIYRAKEALGLLMKKKEYQKRLIKEFNTLKALGGIDYFLICDDLLHYVRSNGAFSMIRGSANGSLIAFVFGFGLIDPIKHGILFERFISKYRSLNDIDIDIDIRSEFRGKAIEYLRKRFGKDRVVSVGTYNRMQLKGAIKDVTRVFKDRIENELASNEDLDAAERKALEQQKGEFVFATINKVTSRMDDGMSLEEAVESSASFKEWYDKNEEMVQKFIRPVIGNIRNVSLHPAGVVITPEHVNELLPVRTQVNPRNKKERVISTVWENSHTSREDLNEIGVMVLDVLGVKTLSVVSEVIDLVKKTKGITVDPRRIDLEDKKTLEMFNNGELLGVFQFSGGSASNIVKNTTITEFNDLIVINALARPGALNAKADKYFAERKDDLSLVKYDHPSLEKILGDSLGVLVFSEHILRTASEYAGMHPRRADALRKIIKGKNPKAFSEYKKEFVKGAIRKWGEKEKDNALRIWKKFSKAGSYLFPRGHASSYALLGFICQYLKVHYPVEFFVCHLQYSTQDKYAEIRRVAETVYGIKFLPPGISKPNTKFEASGRAIVWPMTALKQVGDKAANAIAESAPYSSFDDFFRRVDKRRCNKRVVENLIIAGAFKEFGGKKAIFNRYKELRKAKSTEKDNPAFLSKENMIVAMEDVFGFEIISTRNIYKKNLKPYLKMLKNHASFMKVRAGGRAVIFGRVVRTHKIVTKAGKSMAFVDLKDGNDEFKITLFPESYSLVGDYFKKGAHLVVSGEKNIYNKEHALVLQTVKGVGRSNDISLKDGSWVRQIS